MKRGNLISTTAGWSSADWVGSLESRKSRVVPVIRA